MVCLTCQVETPGTPRFCPNCGWALGERPDPGPGSEGLSRPDAHDSSAPGPPPARAGGAGGRALDQARDAWRRLAPRLRSLLVRCHEPGAGWLAAAVVLAAALVVTLVAWWPLRWLPVLISQAISAVGPHSCGSLRGLGLSLCGAVLALISLSGSTATLAALWLLRLPVGRVLRRALALLPPEARFLGAPVFTTVIFTLGWAGIGFHFFTRPGIVPDGLFPAAVGLMAYLMARCEAQLRRLLVTPWAGRDRLSRKARLALAVLVPVLLAMLLTPVTRAPVRDQLVVLLTMLSTYALLAPRTGELLPALRQKLGADRIAS